jgi:hypothetical protein
MNPDILRRALWVIAAVVVVMLGNAVYHIVTEG